MSEVLVLSVKMKSKSFEGERAGGMDRETRMKPKSFFKYQLFSS